MSLGLFSQRARASTAADATPQFAKVEDHRRQPGVNVPGPKPGSKLSEDCVERRARRAGRTGRARWCRPALLADAEICPDQNVKRRMLDPIFSELFEVEESHLVDDGVAVAAGGRKEAIDMSPAVHAP